MSVFVTFVLIVGFGVLMIIGILRLVRDLFSSSVLAAPSSPNEEHGVEIESSDGRQEGSAGTFTVQRD
jgi:hypothetical protein